MLTAEFTIIRVIDRNSPVKGITELRYIDPRKIKKIRELRKRRPITPSVPVGGCSR